MKELVAGPSPFERAAEITPSQVHANLMQKLEDANLRQATRLLGLIEKMEAGKEEEGDFA